MRLLPPLDPSMLLAGDVLLYSASDIIGYIIDIKTAGLFSHVEVVTGIGQTLGARIEGVNIYPPRIDPYLRCVRRGTKPGFPFDSMAAMAEVKDQLGRPYDIGGLFSFFDPWAKTKAFHRICSVLTYQYLVAGGVQPFNPYVDPNLISPNDFWISGSLNTIWKG